MMKKVGKILHSMNLGPDVMHELAQVIKDTPALESAGVCPHVIAAVKETHSNTWRSTQGVSDIIENVIGSKPGDH